MHRVEMRAFTLSSAGRGANAGTANRGDVVVFTPPLQDEGNTVLEVLKLLQAPPWDPDEESITLIQPGDDKGLDQLFSITEGKGGAKFGNVLEMKRIFFAEILNVVVK